MRKFIELLALTIVLAAILFVAQSCTPEGGAPTIWERYAALERDCIAQGKTFQAQVEVIGGSARGRHQCVVERAATPEPEPEHEPEGGA